MDTLKTGFIVVLLLAVLYGVYVVLNKDQAPPNAEIAWHQQQADQELQIDIGSPGESTSSASATGIPGPPSASGPGVSQNSSASLGIPSVVKAELSPIADEPAALQAIPKTVSPAVSSASGASSQIPGLATPAVSELPISPVTAGANALNSAAQSPSPEPPSAQGPASPSNPAVPVPSFMKSGEAGVAAPTLLSNDAAASSDAQKSQTENAASPTDSAATRADSFSSLPALREPSGSWPATQNSTPAPLRPAIKVPEKVSETKPSESPESSASQPSATTADPNASPSATSVYLPGGGATGADATVSADGNSQGRFPGDATAEAAATDTGDKSVTTAAAFDVAMREAQSNLDRQEWYQALFILSKFYDSPDLRSEQRQELLDLLDPLAGKVVYSQDHLIAEAHEVRRGETLAQIAATNQVPPQLLSNINGIENPELLIPGTKLKIVRGPFRANVDLSRKELTLFAGQLYAGRFPISIGQDPAPKPGEYRVIEKQPQRDYYAASGQRISAEDPQNPYGRAWIGLDKELCIHGSPDRGEAGEMGCISLSPLDANDVYGILSQGSSVTIR